MLEIGKRYMVNLNGWVQLANGCEVQRLFGTLVAIGACPVTGFKYVQIDAMTVDINNVVSFLRTDRIEERATIGQSEGKARAFPSAVGVPDSYIDVQH